MRIFEDVTRAIIEEMERGAVPWVRPWKTDRKNFGSVMPANAATGRSYSGINVPILWGSADANGYPSHAWMTFKQALDKGANVRKGERGTHVVFTKSITYKGEDEEIEKIRIESSHTITIDTFVPRSEIDDRYIDDPYYIAPTDQVGQEAFAVIRDAIREKRMVALGRVVISRREHVMMLEAFDKGLLATTLRYPYEVRDQAAYFEDISDLKLPADMKELAAHIVDSKTSHFDPSTFVDHYETALVELLRAKQAGHVIEAPKEEPAPHRVINLMDALRASISADTKKKPAAASAKTRAGAAAGAKRKTGR